VKRGHYTPAVAKEIFQTCLMEESRVINEIDAAHHQANNALKEKNLPHYFSFFHDKLRYKQANRKTIDKAQLSIDTQRYFTRVKDVTSSYQRNETEKQIVYFRTEINGRMPMPLFWLAFSVFHQVGTTPKLI
jgi:hypothetical protein